LLAKTSSNFATPTAPLPIAAIRKVPRMGDKTFEQAAGFLRINGDNPLDRSAVHPEAYPVVERI
jgi:uncharacterized protein